MASSVGSSGGPKQAPPSASDTVLRNALRYTVSAREYAALHKYIISKSKALDRRAPSVDRVNRVMNGDRPPKSRRGSAEVSKGKGREAEMAKETAVSIVGADDFNARAVRHSVRVFIATGVAMKLWTAVMKRLVGSKE